MSISRQNLTIVIVTLKSEKVIHNCIKSINQDIPIIVVENSDDKKVKEALESKYKNVECLLSNFNLGMGSGCNIGIKYSKTDFVLILNADVTLESNSLNEIFNASKSISEFSILAPINSDKKFPNYGFINKKKSLSINSSPFKVDYVDGFAMLINKKQFKDNNFFDENFFLYLENNDLCLRNWHWLWSKFYFNKKNFGILKALKTCLPTYLSSIIKFLFYFLMRNNFKKKIYYNRASGFFNALIGKKSWYRPKI